MPHYCQWDDTGRCPRCGQHMKYASKQAKNPCTPLRVRNTTRHKKKPRKALPE